MRHAWPLLFILPLLAWWLRPAAAPSVASSTPEVSRAHASSLPAPAAAAPSRAFKQAPPMRIRMVRPGENRMLDLVIAFQSEIWFNPPHGRGFEQLEGDEFLDAVDAWGREIIAGLPRPVSEEELQLLGEQVFGLSDMDDYANYLAYSMAAKPLKNPDPQRQRMLIYHRLGRSSYLARVRVLSEIWGGKRLATPEDEVYEKLIEGTLERHAKQVVNRLQSHPDEEVALEQRIALKEKISTVPDEYARSKLQTLLD